jgi:hypothetical protein
VGDHVGMHIRIDALVGRRENDDWAMFRRAKLMLADVPDHVLAAAAECGLLVGRLSLSDPSGAPLCASVRPPAIAWSPG